jgi:hypothetical protein
MTGEVYFFSAKNTAYLLNSPSKIRNEICLAIQYMQSLPQTVSTHTAKRKKSFTLDRVFPWKFDLNLDPSPHPRRFISPTLKTLHFKLSNITRQRPKAGDNLIPFVYHSRPVAEVVELVDTTDSKSVAFAGLGVRVPPSVPNQNS